MSWCIFGVPGFGDHSSISPCSDTCRNISDAVEKDILNPTASTTYDFCDQLSSPADLSLCSSCYSPIKTQFYLSNCKSHTSINPLFLLSANLDIRGGGREKSFFFLLLFLILQDLNLLRSACELKIPIPTPFPIIGSQIFTNIPLGNYSSSSSSSKSRSNSLSYREKLAIGIAIPSTLLLLALLVILLWYIRDYRRKRGSSISNQLPRFPSPPTKPLPQYKPLPPSPPRVKLDSHSPPYHPPGPPLTVFHPTPRLNSLSPSSPAPKPFQPPHQSRPHHEAATQFIITHHPIIHHHDPTTPTTRATTNLTTAGPPSSLFPSPQPQSDMRGPSRMPPSSRGLIMSEHGGGRGRKHRNTKKKIKGRKERVESKVLFV